MVLAFLGETQVGHFSTLNAQGRGRGRGPGEGRRREPPEKTYIFSLRSFLYLFLISSPLGSPEEQTSPVSNRRFPLSRASQARLLPAF